MSGISKWLATILVIAGLLVGIFGSYALFPRTITKEVVKTITKEVPVTVPVEVEKIVEVSVDYKQNVVDALLAEIRADKDLRKCKGVKYDVDEISVKRVYDGFKMTEDSDGDISVSNVKIKLNYDDGKCYNTLTCGLDTENELVC